MLTRYRMKRDSAAGFVPVARARVASEFVPEAIRAGIPHTAAAKRQRDARREERIAAEHLEKLHAARSSADAELEAIEHEIADVERRVIELGDADDRR